MLEAGGRRLLFDTGISHDGLVGNLDRLAIRPDSFEAIVFSHGHFDHTKGLNGLACSTCATARWSRRRSPP
jgi:7,8-dihydropterin-6-yl-methyl-4-(beta-D-ribofuranosyl)aminobenzene 5'-phosphate synthase